jgi:1-acyl-sn-glycerol-3-phosphate acyltransferase
MVNDRVYERGWLSPQGVEAFRWALKTAYDIFAPAEVRGGENLPPAGSGGYIVATNHISYFDAPLVFIPLPRGTRLTAFGTDKYRSNLFMGGFLRMMGVVWVNREAPTPATIKSAVQLLREGHMLGLAPEGTRSQETHALQKAKTGVAYLAVAADVPVIPAAIANTDRVGDDLRHLRRSRVSITFGKPLRFPVPDRREREAKLQGYTEELMCQIAALLPLSYRGVYADNPRLKELLATS